MSWPVDTPPKPSLPPPKLPYFDGPLNVIIAMSRQQQAEVEVWNANEAYKVIEP